MVLEEEVLPSVPYHPVEAEAVVVLVVPGSFPAASSSWAADQQAGPAAPDLRIPAHPSAASVLRAALAVHRRADRDPHRGDRSRYPYS